MRVAILSDIHANLVALDAVLADAGAIDRIWCLGDVVDGGPHPNECLARLRERSALIIAGNHDRDVLAPPPESPDESPVVPVTRWTHRTLTGAHLAVLAALAERAVVGEMTLVHSPDFAFRPPSIADFDTFATAGCAIGHTHIPVVARLRQGDLALAAPRPDVAIPLDAGRVILNVGSVGQSFTEPGVAAYAIYESSSAEGVGSLTPRLVPYSEAAVLEAMRAVGMSAAMIASREAYLAGEVPFIASIIAAHRGLYPAIG